MLPRLSMMRTLLIVSVLALSLPIVAQEPQPSIENPLRTDPYWSFHLAAQSRADAERVLRGSRTPTQAIAAHFRLGSRIGAVRAGRELLDADPAELARGMRLLRERSYEFNEDGTTARRELLDLIALLKQRVAALPANVAESPAYEVMLLDTWVDSGDRDAARRQLLEFAKKYPASELAFDMVISDVDDSYSRDDEQKFEAYRALIREQGETANGARALYRFGFRLAASSQRGPDPTARLLELFDVIRRLESGRYPKGEWTERAPALVHEFFFGTQVVIPAASVPALYAAYLEFVRAHPDLKVQTRVDDPHDWIIRNGIARLGSTGPEKIAAVERFLTDLEGHFEPARVRMLRARFYSALSDPDMLSSDQRDLIDPQEAEARALRSLTLMIESANPVAVMRARGALAAGALADGNYASAHGHYQLLLQQFPDAEWAWVAAMRVADTAEALGRTTEAAAAYEKIAVAYAAQPDVVVLARIAAGQVNEDLARLPAAATSYRAAAAAWASLDEPVMIQFLQDDGVKPIPARTRYDYLTKDKIAARVAGLAAIAGPDTELLYLARRALELEKPREAIRPLGEIQKKYPGSASAVEAAALLRRARFESALMDMAAPEPSNASIERELAALAAGKFDSTVAVAKLAQAAILVRRGKPRDAETLTRTTLERWFAAQPAVTPPQSALDRDVAAIRAALFLPRGGGVFGTRGWNAFDWPDQTEPFIVVARVVLVKTADGREAARPVTFSAHAGDRVLFLTRDDFRALNLILNRIGGTETAEWVNATDLPNQPIGGAPDIAQLWARFFHVRPGHWAGWELTTYPDISRITFDRDGHALAEFTIGYSGGTVELEKENGRWVAKRIVSEWIT